MEVKASLQNLRMAPQKVRLVAGLVRNLKASDAVNQLKFNRKWASKPLAKLVSSAIANAVNNFELDKDNLLVKEIKVDEGKTLHRWIPKAHGRATPIRKRCSHISVTLAEIKDSGVKVAKKQTIEEPVKLSTLLKQDTEESHKKDEKETSKEEVKSGKPGVEKRGHLKTDTAAGKQGFIKKVFQRKSGE